MTSCYLFPRDLRKFLRAWFTAFTEHKTCLKTDESVPFGILRWHYPAALFIFPWDANAIKPHSENIKTSIFFFNHLFWKMTYEKQQLSRDTDMKRITITSTLHGLNYVLKFSKCSFFFGWNDLEKQNKTLVCFQRLFECCLTPSGYTAVQQAQWQPLQTQSDLDLKQYNLKPFFVRATNAVVIQHRAGTKMARLFKAHCV